MRRDAAEAAADGDAIAELKAFGAREEEIAAWRARAEEQDRRAAIVVWDDCWETAQIFAALQTQWHRAGLNGLRTGLDYAAIEPTARMMEIELGRRRFDELRLMEATALKAMAKAESRGHAKTRTQPRPRPRRRGRR